MKRYVAIDVGGSHIACATVIGDRIERRMEMPVKCRASFKAILPAMEAAVSNVLDGQPADGVSMGFPALVNRNAARVLSTPAGKYEDAVSIDFVDWARSRFDLPIRLELDGRMALLGERHCGALRGEDDAVLLALGTGIGTAAIIGGRLLVGRSGLAGVLGGHLSLDAAGPECICGSIGCIESYASGWALPRLIATASHGFEAADRPAPDDFEKLFARAGAGDRTAQIVRDQCLAAWATAALNLIHAYDASVILLTGGISRAPEVADFVRRHVGAHAWTIGETPEVRTGLLGGDAALFGAASLWEEAV